jgi:hypothetical protein
LLFKLADKEDAAGYVARAIADNFDKLPPNVQNLLVKLADNKDAVKDIVDAVYHIFYKLPENLRNELQKILGKHGYSIG